MRNKGSVKESMTVKENQDRKKNIIVALTKGVAIN